MELFPSNSNVDFLGWRKVSITISIILMIVSIGLITTRGRAKLVVGVARGKQNIDKRRSIAERDVKRQLQREMKLDMR